MEGKCDATLAVYLRYPLYTAPICRSMAAQALPTYISFEQYFGQFSMKRVCCPCLGYDSSFGRVYGVIIQTTRIMQCLNRKHLFSLRLLFRTGVPFQGSPENSQMHVQKKTFYDYLENSRCMCNFFFFLNPGRGLSCFLDEYKLC